MPQSPAPDPIPKRKRTYLITYDLNAPGKNYRPLEQRLRDLSAKRILESVWLFESLAAEQARVVFDDLKRHVLDANDSLFITEIGSFRLEENIPSPKALL